MFRAGNGLLLMTVMVTPSTVSTGFRSTPVSLYKTNDTSITRRRGWEERVSSLLENQKQSRDESIRTLIKQRYEQHKYTLVEEAFPMEVNLSSSPTEVPHPSPPPNPHINRIAILGTPNAGKSTLLNALVHHTASAEGRGAGMTRRQVRTTTTVHNTQLVFIDTPGLEIRSVARVHRAASRNLNDIAYDAIGAADSVLLCVPFAKGGFLDRDQRAVVEAVSRRCLQRKKPLDLAITKVDLVYTTRQQSSYFAFRAELEGLGVPFRKSIETSVFKARGIVELKDYLCMMAVPGAWEGKPAHTLLATANEVIWQSFFEHLPHTIPYQARWNIVGWTRQVDSRTEVFVEVFFDRPAFMGVFMQNVGALSQTCKRVMERETEKKYVFVFQVFGTAAGVAPQ